jgi:hypothetical protein
MSSARKTPEYERRSWKGTGKGEVDPRPARRARRVVGTIIALLLLALFAWNLRPRSGTTTCVFLGAADEYDVWQAPPLAFVSETLSDFMTLDERKASRPWKVQCTKLSWVPGQGPLSSADFDHGTASLSSETDVVIVYLAAQGISHSDDGSETAMLLEDKRGAISLEKLLGQLHECPAHVKLLALDAGSIESDPVRGMVVNEFPKLVKKTIDDLGYKDVWVLLSHQQFEKSHAAFGEHRSVFGYYVARGLSGQADANDDGVIELAELELYVCGHVYAYVREADKQNQTPVLYPASSDKVRVPLMPRAKEARPTEAAADDNEENAGDADKKPKREAARPSRWPSVADVFSANRGMRGLSLAAQSPSEGKPAEERKEESAPPANSSPPATVKSEPSPTSDKESSATEAPADASAKKKQQSNKAEAPRAADQAADKPKVKPKTLSDEQRMLDKLIDEWSVCLKRSRAGESDTRWTPVDYAPRFWLKHIEYLMRYESRWLLGSTVDLENQIARRIEARREQVGDSDNSGSEWGAFKEKSLASLQQDDRLRAVIQLRNDLLFKLRYYSAWSAENEQRATDVGNLIDGLRALLTLLNDERARESNSDGWLSDLYVKRREIQKRKVALDRLWEADLKDCLDRPEVPDVANIERLLGLPWLPAEKRRELLSALSAGNFSLKRNDDLLSNRRPQRSTPPDDRGAWKTARRDALLQLKLLRLMQPDKEVDDLVERLEHLSSVDPDSAREVGAKLASAYRDLEVESDAKTPDQDQRLRLADVRDSDTSQTLFLARPFFKVVVPWKLTFEPPRPKQAALNVNDFTEIKFVIRASPPRALTARWSLVGYNTGLIELKENEKTTDTIELATDGLPRELLFHVRAKKEAADNIILRLMVEPPDEAPRESDPITLTLPERKTIELVADDEHEGKRIARLEQDTLAVRLRPYPRQISKFRLALRNPSQRERKVKYQWYALDKTVLLVDEVATWPLTKRGESTPHRKLIHEVSSVPLPPGSKEVGLCFPPLPKPANSDAAPATPAKSDTPPANKEKVNIGDGLLCRVTDLETDENTDFWIDVVPLHPRTYVSAEVNVDLQANDMINVLVQPRANVPPKDETKVTCRIESSTGEPQTVTMPKGQPKELQLKAPSTSARSQPVRLVIDVDDYPRAFRFDVRPGTLGKLDLEQLEYRVEFDSPPPGTWHKKGEPYRAMLRVDVPPDWFNAENYLLVKVPDSPTQQYAYLADRRLVAELLPAEKEGELAVECTVEDVQTEFDTKPYADKDITLVAMLHGREETDSRFLWLDSLPPRIDADSRQQGVLGETMTLKFKVTDERADGDPGQVAKVEVELATDNKGQMKEPLELPVTDGVYEWPIQADQIKRPGGWIALVRATDMAGNQSKTVPIPFTIKPPPPKPVAKAGGGNMSIAIKGTVTIRDAPAKSFNVTVRGASAVPPETTDNEGKFGMSLPPGKYTLTFSGVDQARAVQFSKELTVPENAAGPVQKSFALK